MLLAKKSPRGRKRKYFPSEKTLAKALAKPGRKYKVMTVYGFKTAKNAQTNISHAMTRYGHNVGATYKKRVETEFTYDIYIYGK